MSKYKIWFIRIIASLILATTVCVSFGACSNTDNSNDIQAYTTQVVSAAEATTYDEFYLEALRDKIGYIIDPKRVKEMDIPDIAKKALNAINTVYVDEDKNKVVVSMENLNNKYIALFKVYVTESEAVKFKEFGASIAS